MSDPEREYLNDIPFHSEGEYLESLFVVLDLLLFSDPKQRLLARGLSSPQDIDTWTGMVSDRLEMTESVHGTLPVMEQILSKLDAPYYIRYLLAFLLRCAIDPSYEGQAASEAGRDGFTLYELCRLFATPVEQDDPSAVFSLVELGRRSFSVLFPQLLLREQRSGKSIAGMLPLMDARLLAILLGKGGEAPLMQGMEEYLPKEEAKDTGEAVLTLSKRQESTVPEITVIWGPAGSGKKDIITGLSDHIHKGLLFYTVTRPEPGADRLSERLSTELMLFSRECLIGGLVPVILNAQCLSEALQKELLSFLRVIILPDTGSIFLLMDAEEVPDYLKKCFFITTEELRGSERSALWKEILPENAGITPEGIEALANTFILTKGQIADAAEQAIRLSGPDSPVTEDILYEVCYAQLGHPLKHHTQRMKSPFAWDDLKMGPAEKSMLRDFANSVRYRDFVMQEWNFRQKIPYGTGFTALFYGPPGTGKTMAAQVIANELHMELYRIDLSQLIDKYVGETEKNIKRVFTEAGRSNSVLFFDEADAIFNRRLEAGSSNDRFANIESSLLLQCIEEYTGVTILATNNMTAIDPAFMRRFRFCIPFNEPDEEIRYQIWSSVFPKEAPVDKKVDFKELAVIFPFTGAVIKNVALQAAYLSAETGGKSIGPLEIMVAVRRELEKNHRVLSRDMMGKYGKLYPEVIAWNSDAGGEATDG